MKALRSLLVLAFIGLATATASAQFANSSSNSSASGSSIWNTVNTDGYSRIYVSYNPMNLKLDFPGAENAKFNGFSVGYLKGIGLSQRIPLYLEVGGALRYAAYSEDYFDENLKYNIFALNIPVSVAYRFNITDDFSISPNFGFDFRINLFGKGKYDYGDGDKEDWNVFDDQEMLDYDPTYAEAWKRFQMGWHIGVGLDYKALHFGVDYGTDFMEIAEKTTFSTTSITLGFNF